MAEFIHVVDDDPAIRDAILFLLDAAGYQGRGYASAEALMLALPQLEPGCIISDVRMPGLSGMDLVRALKAAGAALPVVLITGHGDIPLAVEAMREGVVDFLEKPFRDDALLAALERAGRQTGVAESSAFQQVLARLSGRERQVLEGVVAGKINKIIAFELGISPRTVEIYRANVMSKTGSTSLPDLVRRAVAAGFGPV